MADTVTLDLSTLKEKARDIRLDILDSTTRAGSGHPSSYRSAGRASELSARVVIEAARQGDAQAQAIIKRAFTCLGIGISAVINLLHPEVIVIGGGIAHAADVLMPLVLVSVGRHALTSLASSVRITPFTLGDDVTLGRGCCPGRC